MKHAIIGSGHIGTALARAFARNHIAVSIANTRGPETLASLAEELGSGVAPCSLAEALGADMIFLAVPFPAHRDVASRRADWKGKIVVDTMNILDSPSEEILGLVSTQVVARAFAGARVVKAFNHLPARQLGTNPPVPGQRQAVFVSSDDAEASATVAALAADLGFAPIELGTLEGGGAALNVASGEPGGLLFQNLAKLD